MLYDMMSGCLSSSSKNKSKLQFNSVYMNEKVFGSKLENVS